MSDFGKAIASAYAVQGLSVELGKGVLNGTLEPKADVRFPLKMANRHGLIAGATGTGKTRTLQLIAEQLSEQAHKCVYIPENGIDLERFDEDGFPDPSRFHGWLFSVEDNAARPGMPDRISYQYLFDAPTTGCPTPTQGLRRVQMTEGHVAVVDDQRGCPTYVGHLATAGADGAPHVTPVWVDYDGEHVLVNSAYGRAKVRHIQRDPRVSIDVLPAEDQQAGYVSVSGTAELVDEGADDHIDKLAKKYLGKDEYPWRNPAEQRVKVVIEPDKVDASGFDD